MHPAVAQVVRWLKPNPRLPDTQRRIAQGVHDLAIEVEPMCEGPELTEGLRYLLLAKDCLVRASMVRDDTAPPLPEPDRTRPIERTPAADLPARRGRIDERPQG